MLIHMTESTEFKGLDPEIAAKTVAVYTTRYPNYNPDSTDPFDVDTVRGRLSLETVDLTLKQGIRIVWIEDGSSTAYMDKIHRRGVGCIKVGKGMGEGRRIGFKTASELPGCKYILWSEPEKAPLIKNCLPDFFQPFEDLETELVVANRDEEAYRTYPKYQIKSEKPCNDLLNAMLHKHGLWQKEKPDLDFLFAPRLYLNNQDNVTALTTKFTLRPPDKPTDKQSVTINLDNWANSIVNPVVIALQKGRATGRGVVEIATVSYRHPKAQTESEIDNEALALKRRNQYIHFVAGAGVMIAHLERKKSRLISSRWTE